LEATDISFQQYMDQIANNFELTEEQRVAFTIIASTIICREVFHFPQWIKQDQLRMLLTGPGGTGKTHVVHAVQVIMSLYGLPHGYCSLAPTAYAALLIDGTTLHSGCNIKVRAKNNRKTFTSENESQALSILASVKKNNNLQQQWKDVHLLLINEISMIDQVLLADVDTSLRYAKENASDFFGGITLIFSGDQFQYPPVGRALYRPMPPASKAPQTEDELLR
jgi:PIF1-like helicase